MYKLNKQTKPNTLMKNFVEAVKRDNEENERELTNEYVRKLCARDAEHLFCKFFRYKNSNKKTFYDTQLHGDPVACNSYVEDDKTLIVYLGKKKKKLLQGGALVIGFPYNDQLVNMQNIASDHSFDYSSNLPTPQILNNIALQLQEIYVRPQCGSTKIESPLDRTPINDVSNINWQPTLVKCVRQTFCKE